MRESSPRWDFFFGGGEGKGREGEKVRFWMALNFCSLLFDGVLTHHIVITDIDYVQVLFEIEHISIWHKCQISVENSCDQCS